MQADLPSSTATQHRWTQASLWSNHQPWTPTHASHPALASPPSTLAGAKRKLTPDLDDDLPPATGLDALFKRQRRFQSHSSLSDSDDQDEFPRTPQSNLLDDSMDWAADPPASSGPTSNYHQSTAVPPWRAPSPSQAIHRLQLLREAHLPTIATYASTFAGAAHAREPPPSKVLPMTMQTTDDEYVFSVQLPGYNIDNITVSCKKGNVVTVVADIWHLPSECCHQWDITFDSDVNTSHLRASMDRTSSFLTLSAKRFRRYVPIEYQVDKKPQ